jgi:hypothetical protein
LLQYASINPGSEDLIRLNVARLAAAAGDNAKASSILASLRQSNKPVLKKRIAHDRRLAVLLTEPQGKL